jgi:C4-dicarboxylate transporter DctM subunit
MFLSFFDQPVATAVKESKKGGNRIMAWLSLFFGLFLIFALMRVPVAFSMSMSTFITMLAAGITLDGVGTAIFNGLNSFTFLAIPAFIIAGDIMGATGISTSILTFTESIIGRLRGSVGATTIVTSLLFGTLTGSSLATVTAIGSMMTPEMERRGYARNYSAAMVASCGFLGILIPPSIPGIVYSMMSGENLLKVWLCTVVPGIMCGTGYIIVNYIKYGIKEEKIKKPFHLWEYLCGIGFATKKSMLALIMPLIIFYGIYGGIFTPTEAGGVAVFYGMMVGWVILPLTGKRPASKFFDLIKDSAVSTSSITIIIGLAAVTGKMIIFTGIPTMATQALMAVTDSKIIFLLLINLLLIVAGMFMETNSAILLLGPILIPVAVAYGVDPIHFAAIMLLNMEIGMITPPMAGNLFVAARISNLSIDAILKELGPFFSVTIVTLLIVTYCPSLVLFVPNML